ncbi:NAD-dependent epimerase/dehydratase family protein [Rhizobium sp. SSA_523]|uniref:NAD-dependent epimerase/dehydratase family protein n=1 Tax=Rhizobium sp. SSA_523 TaxID=2952477 RepID=UPI002090CF09|nr:NAD-dependent epimerase/dehydratase family protein [Rhizobium sp. SSA_523]MCO5734745.1 NAD-dependent epimerase/dehydratase family protein [Rhizobium sp. SSA_523]WKC22984.1 NAD-dependent epimerase/dehydratase family protein [Rhizobium sp. SSA_523]
MKSILVLGGDGFCGWPTALHLSANGFRVGIVDNLSRRRIDEELKASSLTPIASIGDRLAAWKKASSEDITFYPIDVAHDYQGLRNLLSEFKPDAVVHFAEQRSAPYSMKSPQHKHYTVDNNVSGTHNLLAAIVELARDIHIVHLGTVGVYGYDGSELAMPEGYLDVIIREPGGREHKRSILYPTQPGSIYHMTKSLDQLLFQYYAHNDRLRISDLHQGVVWGTQTDETRRDDALINRFDYDGDYGTVLNRFLVQGVVGHALTVHGTGGQTRGFINIRDTVICVRLAIENPPNRGDRVKIFNQVSETKRIRDLAELVAKITGARIAYVENPRNEAAENELAVTNLAFPALGLKPILLQQQLFNETMEIVERFKSRFDPRVVPAMSLWTEQNKPGVVPEM